MQERTKKNYIMAHDPSMCGWGYSIIDEDGKVVKANCIKTASEAKKRRIRKGDDTIRRINEINCQLLRLIRYYHIQYMIAEQPHGSQSATAAKAIGNVEAMLQTIADVLGMSLEWFSEGDSKFRLLHKRSAVKKETINAITKLYEVPWTGIGYRDEAIADSMSIYHIARDTSPMIRGFLTKSII